MRNQNEIVPFIASHPGSLILDEIQFRKISQTDLAAQMGIQKSLLN
jgi:HTH-type transcriptional regulator/antitoxin HigA